MVTTEDQESMGQSWIAWRDSKIYYGTSKGNHPNVIDVRNPSVTSYTVKGLSPNTYYFVIKAYDSSGKESDPSNEVSKSVP